MTRPVLAALAALLLACGGTDPAAERFPTDVTADAADATSDDVGADAVSDATADALPDGDAGSDADVADDAVADATPDVSSDGDGGTGGACETSPEEPNDTRETAFALVDGLAIDALLCRGEDDWYGVALAAGEVLDVRIAFEHDAGDLELAWYRGDETELSGESVTAEDEERLQIGPFDAPTEVRVQVYGFRNATGPYRLEATLVDVTVGDEAEVGGRVQYEDRIFGLLGFTGETELLPARSVVVEVVQEETGIAVARTLTDDDGAYLVRFAAAPDATYRVQVVATVEYDGFVADVTDRSGESAVYRSASEAFVPGSSEAVDLLADADNAGGAFNIADITLDAFRFVATYTDERPPRLSYAWQRPLSYSCGSCYSDNRIRLGGQLEDPDEYDDHIILHEFGHFFVEHFSADDSPGGSHRDRQVEPLLEYGEGLAYFWAAMVTDDPVIVDNFLGDRRAIDFEYATQNGEVRDDMYGTVDGTAFGNRREEVTGAILWDFYDAASDDEPWDTIELGAAGMMDILLRYFEGGDTPVNIGQRGIELTDWLNGALCLYPETRDGAGDILAARGFNWDPVAELNCDF